jgi:hypothetical protein
MSRIDHQEILEKFIGSRAVDFAALGKFVAENGALIATSGRGDYGVRFGHYNILACFNIGPIDVHVGNLATHSQALKHDVAGH